MNRAYHIEAAEGLLAKQGDPLTVLAHVALAWLYPPAPGPASWPEVTLPDEQLSEMRAVDLRA